MLLFKVIDNKGNIRNDIYCLKGFLHSALATQLLYQDLDSEGRGFLLTAKLNQDIIENLFGAIRRRAGYNANPSARNFRFALQQNIFIRLTQSTSFNSNCAPDEEDKIDLENYDDIICDENNSNETCLASENSVSDEETETNDMLISDSDSVRYITPTLENNSIKYFCGYVIFKLLQKFRCENCKNTLSTNNDLKDSNELLILNRDFGISMCANYLQMPAEEIYHVGIICIQVYNEYFDVYKTAKNIKKTLINICEREILKKNPTFFMGVQECIAHKQFFISHFIKVKLLFSLKWLSADLKQNVDKTKKLLNI